jgi:hypothetical protein
METFKFIKETIFRNSRRGNEELKANVKLYSYGFSNFTLQKYQKH